MARRLLALFLSFVMVFSFAVSAYAESNVSNDDTSYYEFDDVTDGEGLLIAGEGSEPEICETCGSNPCTCEKEEETSSPCEICGQAPCTCKKDEEPTICEVCNADPCICEDEASVCETCGQEPCVCEAADPVVCETCGNEPCTCEQAAPVCPGDDTCTIEGCQNHNPPALAQTCEECGVELVEGAVHAEDCSQYVESQPQSEIYDTLMAAETVEEMYLALLGFMESDPDGLFELSTEELQEIYDYAAELNETVPSEDYEDLCDTLQYIAGEFDLNGAEVLLPSGYIYFDLSFGNVVINENTYTGYGPNGALITGDHDDDYQYYIFQGNGSTKYTKNLPSYATVTYKGEEWGDYITDHPSKSDAGDDSVDELIAAWDEANKGTRVATANRIEVSTKTNGTIFNITIDNIWSTHQPGGDNLYQAMSIRSYGTATFGDTKDIFTNAAKNVVVNLYVKGDNRLGRIHCATEDGRNGVYRSDTNHTNVINFSGDADATLTVANMAENLAGTAGAHTAAMIGGTDQKDHSFKMTFDDITVYAGGGRLDFGTAIGGGGNGDGRVTIDGGRITAVNSATGTAIGGGCGTTGPGGYGNVTITDGEVYAYNYTPHYTSETSKAYTDAMPTAIGGGSSGTQIGGTGIVNITGGYVYAYSEVGNAIGGGGGGNGEHEGRFYNTYGGTADVTISGDAEVDAISGLGCAIGGGPGGGRDYVIADGKLPNATIGDGTLNASANADGGTAKLTISGSPTIRSGSIGGGSPLDQNRDYGATVGAAVVNISGGTIHGQVVMDGVIKNVPEEIDLTNGESSSFTMSGGLIDNTPSGSAYHFVEENGGAVYIHSGTATMSGGIIQNASAPLGGAIYVNGGDFTLSGTGLIRDCHATDETESTSKDMGGAVYVEGGNVRITGGKIKNCYAARGGAVYVTGDDEGGGDFFMSGGTIDGGTVTENATFGGAVYVDGGNFTMESGTLTNNAVPNNGGAVYITRGTVIIGKEDCGDDHLHPVLSDNTAKYGGAVAVSGSDPVIHCCQMTGNDATEYGGAVYVAGGSLTMNNGTIGGTETEDANTAKNGGAVYMAGGDFIMSNGSIIKNTATINGGALYVARGNVTIHHGIINENSATDGGAVYLAGDADTELTMESGQMNDNYASENGGAIYATSGTLYIGLENCSGKDNDQSKHTAKGAGRHHPLIQSNEAGVSGGGIAISKETGGAGGVVYFYCGAATGNTNSTNDKGMGKNVFMDGGEFHFYDGTNVGVPRDPDLVIVGGKLWNECIDEDWITLKYYATNDASKSSMEGLAAENEVMNLPNAEAFFPVPSGQHFAGWTAKGIASGEGSKFVRTKGEYVASGDPVEILDAQRDSTGKNSPVWDGDGTDDTIHLYALWVDSAYDITYVNILNYGTETNTPGRYEVTTRDVKTMIPAILKDGYVLKGWYIYQDLGQNANWGYEPAYVNNGSTAYSNLNYEALETATPSQYLPVADNGTLELPTGLNTFGDITLIADYELAYSDLTIRKTGAGSIDENQAFIFHVVNNGLSASENTVTNPEKKAELDAAIAAVKEALTVVVEGDGSVVIKHLPLGTYTVTEDRDWSWRYGTTSSDPANGQVTLGLNDPKTVTFTNTRTEGKWLSGDWYTENWWGETPIRKKDDYIDPTKVKTN